MAHRWWQEAAFQGHVQSMKNLGADFWNGDGVEKDDREEVFWYGLAAQSGDAQVMFYTSWFTLNGIGTEMNRREGMALIHKAAWTGYAPGNDFLNELKERNK